MTSTTDVTSSDSDSTGLRPLYRLAAYAFILQGVVFVALAVLIPSNADVVAPHSEIDFAEFLTDLDESPTAFLSIKALFIALRTLYGISLIGMAYVWWNKNRSAAILIVSFILVSIPVINIAQLMGMALVPLAADHAAASALGDTATMAALEADASSIYLIAEYLDTFVNVVTFIGLLGAMFWLSTRVAGLERIKWILPLLMVLPFNRYVDVEAIQLLSGLLNVVATGAYFFLMGRFMVARADDRPRVT